MINGFYIIPNNSKEKAKDILTEAFSLAHTIDCECKYKNEPTRRTETESSIKEYIDSIFDSNDWTLDIINRNIYNRGQIKDTEDLCEICLHSSSIVSTSITYGNCHSHWRLLYVKMNLKSLDILINKFDLKLRNI